MKKFLPLIAGCLLAAGVGAQSEKCATMTSLEYRMQHDPTLKARLEQHRATERSSVDYDTTGYMVIPVVFHVVYDPSAPEQNIDDSLILSQISVLNKDYSYTHAGVSTTLPIFDSLTGDAGFRFQLATIDPSGNPTTGIERISSTTNHSLTFFTNSVKASSTGGADPWPRDQYLNIWVCNMFPVVLGYSTFPQDDPMLDGVVIGYNYIGERPGASTAPNNLGRTASHECGHWLSMRHIWGDGDCTMDDFVWDTPDSDAASSSDCALSRNNCTDAGNLFWHGTDPVDMVQNFMDYSADGCMTMFTRGQVGRMWHNVIDLRGGLFNSMGCDTPRINGYVLTRNLTCPASCDGEATVTVVNGTAPLHYLWDTPGADTTAMVSGLCKGIYTVRVIDADNDTMYIKSCVHTSTNLTGTCAVTNDTCGTCGSVTVTALGGNSAYTYAFDGAAAQTSNVQGGLAPGTHTVTIADSCGSQVTLTFNVADISGIAEVTNGADLIAVYPNPAAQNVTISVKNPQSGVLKTIVLRDAVGRQVKQLELNGNQYVNISLNDLANGLYHIAIELQNGLLISDKKLIVNK